ncbi:TetR/AcrR family transcriptional regulator [Actinacidiphila alni]|uniref:TetR/AcrR family transcriptional regulator n=1 Tax=Actinacidiphila alni TaxID=380248 RepID=UPI0033C4EF74
MPDESAAPVRVRKRAPRSDSRRNIDRILAAAESLIARVGPQVTLGEIAKEAGVGPATLYRHFPSRMHLFEGVYRGRVGQLAARAPELAQGGDPTAALLTWLHEFVDLVVEAHAVLAGLLAQGLRETDPAANSQWGRTRLVAAAELLLPPAQACGSVRADLTPDQLVALLTGLTIAVYSLREGAGGASGGGTRAASGAGVGDSGDTGAARLDSRFAVALLLEGLTPRG